MSRIGKQPVPIPSGVDVKIDGRRATVKGPKGLLSRDLPLGVEVELGSDSLQVLPPSAHGCGYASVGADALALRCA